MMSSSIKNEKSFSAMDIYFELDSVQSILDEEKKEISKNEEKFKEIISSLKKILGCAPKEKIFN